MIYIFTALYCEAHIFVKQFHLEKNLENTQFQEFYQEAAGIRLTVTGVGEIAAASAVSSICTKYKPSEKDVLLNIGICAHTAGKDGIFLCSKIVERATGKTFYPDILYRHDFCEAVIITGMMPWNGEKGSLLLSAANSGVTLYDMEAAAIYQAGSYFFGPHQMVFLKVVSDGGTAKVVSKEMAEHCMEIYQDVVFDFMKCVPAILCRNEAKEKDLWQEERWVERLCAELHCSKVMKDSLKQHIHYLALAKVDYVSVIWDMHREGLLPCKDKREGKLRFEEFKRRLF